MGLCWFFNCLYWNFGMFKLHYVLLYYNAFHSDFVEQVSSYFNSGVLKLFVLKIDLIIY